MKQERLRRAEERRIEDDMQFLNTVIQVEERAARKEKQAKLSALAKQKEAAQEQEWLKAALELEESVHCA